MFDKFVTYAPSTVIIRDNHNYVIANELSLMAIDPVKCEIVQYGHMVKAERRQLEQAGCVIGSPLKNGTVADFTLACNFFEQIITTYFKRPHYFMRRPVIVLCLPESTHAEMRTFIEVIKYTAYAKFVDPTEETYRSFYERALEIAQGKPLKKYYDYVYEIIPAP